MVSVAVVLPRPRPRPQSVHQSPQPKLRSSIESLSFRLSLSRSFQQFLALSPSKPIDNRFHVNARHAPQLPYSTIHFGLSNGSNGHGGGLPSGVLLGFFSVAQHQGKTPEEHQKNPEEPRSQNPGVPQKEENTSLVTSPPREQYNKKEVAVAVAIWHDRGHVRATARVSEELEKSSELRAQSSERSGGLRKP